MLRTAKAMVSEGIPFRGVLFAGLMIKNGKVSNRRCMHAWCLNDSVNGCGMHAAWQCKRVAVQQSAGGYSG